MIKNRSCFPKRFKKKKRKKNEINKRSVITSTHTFLPLSGGKKFFATRKISTIGIERSEYPNLLLGGLGMFLYLPLHSYLARVVSYLE